MSLTTSEHIYAMGPPFTEIHGLLAECDKKQLYGVPLVIGTPARITEPALVNWGIHLNGDATVVNGKQIKKITIARALADASYAAEWSDNNGRPSPAWISVISEATSACGLHGLYDGLNTIVGLMAQTVLAAMCTVEKNDEIHAYDIGCGTGKTSHAMMLQLNALGTLGERIKKRMRLTLIDPSGENIRAAQTILVPFFQGNGANLRTMVCNEKEALEAAQAGSINLVVANAVFHHFTHSAYIRRLKTALADGGCVVSGDYHTSVWQHPEYLIKLLQEIGLERATLGRIRNCFKDHQLPDATELAQAHYQTQANTEMIAYWAKIIDECRKRDVMPSPMLEAHQTSAQRRSWFAREGFLVEPFDVMRDFYREVLAKRKGNTPNETDVQFLARRPISRLTSTNMLIQPNSDLARVMVARKPLAVR